MSSLTGRADSDDAEQPLAAGGVQVDVAALYASYHAKLREGALSVLAPSGIGELAADAVQCVMQNLQQMHRNGRLTPREDWAAYLWKSARNSALKIVDDRRRHRTQSLDVLVEAGRDFADRTAGQDPVGEHVILAQQTEQLREAIDHLGLDPRQRRILAGFYFEDLTDGDLARELGISRTRVGVIRRAVQNQLGAHFQGGDQ